MSILLDIEPEDIQEIPPFNMPVEEWNWISNNSIKHNKSQDFEDSMDSLST